ncbi:CGNR zinc finger domain-containing protein [Micromonospora arida]|uniref:CGNR zinc finger domain-containing protein n=1 Tax=Micromonospora arida TaxID=2203715 RepID=UPI0036BEAA36
MRLAIELANTVRTRRGEVCDELQTPADLAAWLGRVSFLCAVPVDNEALNTVGSAELAAARGIRTVIRAIAGAVSASQIPAAADVESLNAAARMAPRWQELAFADTEPRLTTRHGAAAMTGAIAEVAADAVALVAAGHLGTCAAPGCVLLFLRDRPNREWCGNSCGNRVRVARHYDRRKHAASDGEAV